MKANLLTGTRVVSVEKRDRFGRAEHSGERVADVLAALALPAFVLALVVSRLALGASGRRRAGTPRRGK